MNINEKLYDVNIYVYTNIKGPRKKEGIGIYILETATMKGPATLTKFVELGETTENRASLIILLESLKRLHGNCNLTIHTQSNYVAAGFEQGRVDKWQQNGWKNSRGEDVANKEEWLEMAILLHGKQFSFKVNENHSYLSWMKSEIEKRGANG